MYKMKQHMRESENYSMGCGYNSGISYENNYEEIANRLAKPSGEYE